MSRTRPYIPQGRIEPVNFTDEQEAIAAALSELTAHLAAGLLSILLAYGLALVVQLYLDLELPL